MDQEQNNVVASPLSLTPNQIANNETDQAFSQTVPTTEVPPPNNKVKLLIGILTLLLVVAGVGGFLFFKFKSEAPASQSTPTVPNNESTVGQSSSTSDVVTGDATTTQQVGSRAILAPEDNAFYTLKQLAEGLVLSGDMGIATSTVTTIANGEKWDESAARKYVEGNKEALFLLSKASTQKGYQDPFYLKLVDTSKIAEEDVINRSSPIDSFRRAVTLSNVEFEVALYDKNFAKAKQLLFEKLALANIILNSQGELITGVVASAVKTQALTNLVPRLIKVQKLDETSSLDFEKALTSYELPSEAYVNFLGTEARMVKMGNEVVINTAVKEYRDNVEVISVLRTAADAVYPILENGMSKYRSENAKECTDINKLAAANQMDYDARQIEMTPPYSGNNESNIMFYKIAQTTFLKMLTISSVWFSETHDVYRKCDDALATSVAKTIVAIKAYKDTTGNLPARLEELVPKYLSTLPLDPYSYSRPLIYSNQNNYVYSLGRDKIDGGGSTEKIDWRKMNDPTFPLIK
jgi:hypothetical protein